MVERNESPILLGIAEDGEDNAGRLVFADWLEERGHAARAEFIRVQCELSSDKLAPSRRKLLLQRERDLLDGHRDAWCRAIGLPVQDVHFERGLISMARLSQWPGDKILEPEVAAALATVTELDLSGIKLGDNELTAFAKQMRLPALRKLFLNDNDLTDAGAKALASANGFPALDTVYLFRNPVTDAARVALEDSTQFTLANLDVGAHADGYCMSPGQSEMARRLFVRAHLLPVVRQHFDTYPLLRSANLCVAQYWNDEANDAVHGELVVSELFEPVLTGLDEGADPNIPNTRIRSRYGSDSSSRIFFWDIAPWDDNLGAIPVWAAFAPEGADQEMNFSEAYAPAVRFYRHGGHVFMPMLRPQLDGVLPESGWEE
jgi:uncharacterized protein (TIGR02996 family)